jgi:hypothetical protein
MPRLADFLPFLTPPDVAQGIVRGMLRRRSVLDMPAWLGAFYLWFDLAPGLLRRLVALGGHGRRDYGHVDWEYVPRHLDDRP